MLYVTAVHSCFFVTVSRRWSSSSIGARCVVTQNDWSEFSALAARLVSVSASNARADRLAHAHQTGGVVEARRVACAAKSRQNHVLDRAEANAGPAATRRARAVDGCVVDVVAKRLVRESNQQSFCPREVWLMLVNFGERKAFIVSFCPVALPFVVFKGCVYF
jgi:hypothetical protein